MDPSSDPFPSSLPGYDSPHIFDSEMGVSMPEEDLEFFSSALAQESPGQFFRDDSLTNFANSPYQSPVSTKSQNVPEVSKSMASDTLFSASPESSSQDSSSDSSGRHKRKTSSRSSHSALNGRDITMTDDLRPRSWKAGVVTHSEPAFGFPSSNIPGHISYESSNRAMENDFDFDSAASSPSPNMNSNTPVYSGLRHIAIPYRVSPQSSASLISNQQAIKRSQEAIPMAKTILSGTKAPAFLNSRSSPSSSNEEYIDGTILNGMEQLSTWPYGHQTTYSHYTGVTPPVNYSVSAFGAPSFSSGSRRGSRQRTMLRPYLTVHPTPHKSRVETQIPIKLTLYPMPQGVTKLHLRTHTISKPKLLAKPTPAKSPDILELYTMLVCTSAMQDPVKMRRAFARAAQPALEVKAEEGRRSSAGDALAEDDENRPLNGGEVNICAGCITRERKRAARKKSKKPDEEEVWQKDEAKRIIVFNTTEVKDWQKPVAANAGLNGVDSTQVGAFEEQGPLVPEGAMQIDVPMRIACYCRHQNEKLGFQVVFTIKDCQDNLIAQAMTNPIIITDDHKTHAPPSAMPPIGTMFMENAQVPGGGIFTREPFENYSSAPFRTAHSTPDLQKLQQSFNPYFGPHTASPFAVPPTPSQNTSTTLTPHNLSRQASPSAPTGPMHKKRKASGSGKLPDGLIMTRLQTQQSTGIPNQSWTTTAPSSATTAVTSPFSPSFPTYHNTHERAHGLPPISRPAQLRTGPPTPTSNDMSFFTSANRSQSLENLSAVQQMFSPPHSTRPSRASSPVSAPHSAVTMSVGPPHPRTNIMYGLPVSSTPTTPTINKLIPSEGTKAGGIEVTCLGSGFYQGLEVMFGDSLATTTTYWGETSLVCLLPPAIRAGTVPVTFKHHYQQQLQGQRYPVPKNQVYFKYIDDDEQEILRHALALVHQKMTGRIEDAGEIARRIINNHPTGPGTWGGTLSQGNDQQRQMSALQTCLAGSLDLEVGLLKCLDLIDLDDSPFQAQLNLRRANGQSMLHLSASLGFHRLVAGLLARGANPDLRDNNGMSPMHMAVLNGHPQIVRRLRVARGDPSLRSLLGFTPAEMAPSQGVFDAIQSIHHTRSRSAGAHSVSKQSRSSSAVSLRSFWGPPSATQSFNADETSFGQSDDSSDETDLDDPRSRQVETPAQLWAQSRRTSVAMDPSIVIDHAPEQLVEATGLVSPAAAMTAWRDHLAAQIQHFQQSVIWTLPNLQIPTLPPMPNLPDYQTYPMVRRFSALVPQRVSRPSTSSGDEKENDHRWWDLLTGAASSPPAYEEIYPAKQQQADLETKQASVVQAATDALLDQKCTVTFDVHQGGISTKVAQTSSVHEPSSVNDRAKRVKRLRSDRKLFFVWIPLLILVMVAMLKDRVPQVWHGAQQLYDLFQSRQPEKILEVL